MAALMAGVQYGLSSQSNFHENKSLIFVKLTDSAQRAIEDFLKNRNKTSQNPTIQFTENEGVTRGQLSFPSSQSSNGTAGFTFSLSSNHDIEGPQGSFECVQQTSTRSLESLGALPYKMRIQANDDVYEKTRHRMAVCEENNKNKATRVIKANGPDIGRKVKVKTTGRSIPGPVNRHREQPSIPTNVSQSSRLPSSSSSSNLYSNFSSSTALTSSLSSSTFSTSSLPHAPTSTVSSNTYKPISSNPQARAQPDKKLSDLARRPLKERLIHVLALRTYKKPELYDRITREGLRERDRSSMTAVLKQVAAMRDNEYHLHRHVWNDVHEDWPFYTEQDRAMLKRRKPQNLTPPGSSDGSSGSGQSPNSTHPGSPPAISAPPPSLIASKRPGYYQGNDGLQTKRPRISHYRKPEPSISSIAAASATVTSNNNSSQNTMTTTTTTTTTPTATSTTPTPIATATSTTPTPTQTQTLTSTPTATATSITPTTTTTTMHDNTRTTNVNGNSNSDNVLNNKNDWDSALTLKGHNNHRNDNNNKTNNSDMVNNRSYGMSKLCITPTSDNEDNNQHSKDNSSNNDNNSNNQQQQRWQQQQQQQQHQSLILGRNDNNGNNNNRSDNVRTMNNSSSDGRSSGLTYGASPNGLNDRHDKPGSNSVGGDRVYRNDKNDRKNRKEKDAGRNNNEREQRRRDRDNNSNNNNDLLSLGASNSSANSGCNSIVPSIEPSSLSPPIESNSPTVESHVDSAFPDYVTQYTTVSSEEQKQRYKRDFSADYDEYRRLHTIIAMVPARFAELEVARKNEIMSGNTEKSEAIEKVIIAEYKATRTDPAHLETKKRFYYLHEKLSFIKRLVDEYDSQFYSNINMSEFSSTKNNSEDIMNAGGFRY